jgi:penicillin-binding protein 1B
LARASRDEAERLVRYKRPRLGFFARWRRRIFRPLVIVPFLLLIAAGAGVFAYYWSIYSARIDEVLLNGEVFTRTSGIYAAAREIKTGQRFTPDELVAHLKRAGYVEESQQADAARGRYQLNPTSVEIKPGEDAKIDGAPAFPRLRVQFDAGRATISGINDLTNNAALNKAELEPELLSAVAGQERAKRKVISFRDLPQHLIRAITVTEDRAFFEHRGINIRGIARAFMRRYDIDPNSPLARQGGSSITQQLVKNLWLSPEQTWTRKASEAFMSVILETRLSKEEIFTLYCNQIYLGQEGGFSINGVGQGAQAYFHKDVSALSLPESAFLAGIIRSPNRYNPRRNAEKATARRNQVLDSMAETGAITRELAEQAKTTKLELASNTRPDQSEAPYFADYVEAQLEPLFANNNSKTSHLRVYTTIDMDLQRAAYNALNKNLARLDKVFARRVPPGTLQGALVAMDAKTGQIVAMVGGRDYNQSVFNRAADAMRQPGSVFKPFVYAAALNTAYEGGARLITPASTFKDEPKTFFFEDQEYKPGNFGDFFSNKDVTLRDALVKSLNVVTVDVAMEVKIGRVMNLAAKAGLPKPPKPYPAMSLGSYEATPLQIASSYTAFANYGVRVAPAGIARITDGNGNSKQIKQLTPQREKVMGPDVAFVMTSFMQDVVNRGTAAKLRQRGFRYNVAGKTGTSRDGWFAGYTPGLVCAVYIGFDDGSELGLKGADSALPVWADFMGAALAKHPEWQGQWTKPEGVQEADINPENGLLAKPEDPNKRHEYFINNTAPTAESETVAGEEELPAEGELPPDENAPPVSTEENPEPQPAPKGGPQADPNDLRSPGSVTLDIDPTTGLIADPEYCPIIRSKTYIAGQEPRKRCGPAFHGGVKRSP